MFIKIYIIPSLIISPFFTLSCNSWFSIWMSMEFNIMSFIPFLIFFNKNFKENSLKYFIIQTISSSILLISSNSLLLLNHNNLMINFILIFINISLFIKMGAAPFHLWFINMMNNSSWINCLILSTWQKIIPMMLISYIIMEKMFYFIIIYSSIIGTMITLNQQSLRLILSYSSINHISWMLLSMLNSQFLWIFYFIIYSLINLTIIKILNSLKIFYLNQMFYSYMSKPMKIIFMINFLSASGFPPLMGFMMKWYPIFTSMWNKFFLMIIFITILSCISFIYYTMICLFFFFNLNIKNKITLSNKFYMKNYMYMYMLIFISSTNLWLITMYML